MNMNKESPDELKELKRKILAITHDPSLAGADYKKVIRIEGLLENI